MKLRTLLRSGSLFILLCVLSTSVFSQTTLDWSSSFSPAWADGAATRTATNITTGNNCTVTITNSQAGTYENITGSVPSPSVNNNNGRANFFVIAGSTDCIEIDVDWTSDAAYVDVEYVFTKPVYNLTFRVGDIDKASAGSNTYYDRVTITGQNGATTVLPSSITEVNPSNFVNITGNMVYANTSNVQGGNAATNTTNNNTQQGTVEVSFGAQGVTELTIRYDNHPNSQNDPNLQAIAIGNLTFSVVNISGTVWSDINNSANNTFTNIFTAGETGTNAGGLYANLVNNAGTVLTSTAVAADGTYLLTAPQNTNNLTVRLSTTQGVPGSAAPANSVPAGWTNTSPLQATAFNTVTAAITAKDFGIEQLPVTAISVQASASNPGAFNFVTVAASAFQTGTGGNPNTSDAGGGTVTNMRITSFPTNTNAFRINTTTYTNGGTCPPATTCTAWPAGGVTVAYTNGTGPSVPIAIDPIDGLVNSVITFVAIDNAGKEDASAGSVTLPFTLISLSGTVWNDVNNSANNTFTNIFTAGETGSNGGGLYVNLVDNSGNVVNTATVAANGTYTLNAPANTNNLTLRLSTTLGTVGVAAPANSVPTNWANTSPLQTAAFNTAAVSITGRDFGIEQLPVTATSVQATVGNPGAYNFATIAASAFQTGTGGNPNTSDADGGTVSNMRITSFPTNTNAIRINTTTYTNGGTCPPATTCTAWPAGGVTIVYTNGTGPSVAIAIDPIDGAVSSVITFAAIDNAGKEDATPGSVTIPFSIITIAGTVWNDINNSANNTFTNIFTAGETGSNGGGTFINLVDNSGNVVTTATVAANGTYTLNAPPGTNNLTLRLSTTAGTVGSTAPANSVPTGWTNTSPLQTAAFNTAAANITGRDFGMEQLPQSAISVQATVANPGAYNFATIAASAFQTATGGNPNTSDPAGGTVTNMRITSFPTNANAIRINTTTYTNGGTCPPATTCTAWPAGGVTLAYTNGTGPSVAIAIDPIDGAVSSVITFAAIDNAGKEDDSPGSVTIPFSGVTVSGTVWNDINNSANNTFTNIFTAGETGTDGGGIYINLVNNSGVVLTTTAVAANGTYSIFAPPSTANLTLRLSTTQGTVGLAAPANSVPTNWTNTSPLQTATFNTAAANITGRDFGIEQLPESAVSVQATVGNPGGFTFVTVPASAFQTATGGNPNTSDAGGGTVTNMRITSFPTNTNAIRINTTTYTNGGTCPPATTCTAWPGGGVTIAYTNGTGPSVAIAIDPIDGNISSVISFAAIDNASKEDASPGSVTLPFGSIVISGTVWNDINNSAANTFTNIFTAGETGSNGGGVYVNLVDNSGNVVSAATVAANGTYSLTAPGSTSNLTLRLSTTLGTVGAAAPANSVPAGWANTSPLQTTAFNTAAANITGRDFGMEQLPQTAISVQSTIGNPGGFNFSTIAASAFQTATGGNPNTSDPAGGTVANMRITSFPTNTNAITINATTYTNGGTCPPSASCTAWPAGGVTIAYNNGTGPSVPVSIDPIEGNVSAVITFASIDNAGKEDASPGSVTIPFASIPLTGLVFNDANGNLVQNGGEQVVNGTNVGGGLLPGALLYANLVDAAGIVIATATVQNNGVYSFPNVPQSTSNLTLQINTIQGTLGVTKPVLTLPPGWANAGENKNGQAGAADVTRNGEIVITAGTVTITLQNFGLDRLPVSDAKFYSIANPAVNGFITLNGSGPMPGPLSGNDAEDGTLGSANNVVITLLPPEGNELWYNGGHVTTGADGINPPSVNNPFTINNFNPALLRVRATVLGTIGTTFDYAFIDAASLQGNAASYSITWETPLPVTLTSFTGKADNNNTLLHWKVENQEDFDRYEIEYSVSGSGGYTVVGTVYSNNQLTGSYDFTHINAASHGKLGYYRLKMIDKGGTYKYSYVVTVRFDTGVTVDVRPTLLHSGETIRISLAGNTRSVYKVHLFDVAGRTLQQKISNGDNFMLMETGNLKAGSYFIRVVTDGIDQTFKILIQ